MLISQGKWIWLSGCDAVNAYVDFKRKLVLNKEASTKIQLSVDGNYALYLNGCFVNSGQYPDYPEYKVYDELELTQWVKDGQNELLIRVWWPGVDHFSYRVEKAGLLYAVYSGERVLAVSDEQTLAARNTAFQSGNVHKLTEQLGFSFAYDARNAGKEVFEPACVVQKQTTLYPRPIKKVVIGDRLPSKLKTWGTFIECPWQKAGEQMQNAALSVRYWGPDSIWNGEEGTEFTCDGNDGIYLIFDMGSEQVGYLDLELELPQDALVLGGYGEHLEDLRVRASIGGRNFVFHYHGVAGKNRFFMPLRRLGLRYLQLHIYAPSVKVYYAGVRPTTYPLNEYPIAIKDRLHRKIYEVCIHTLKQCMHDHYEDTPWREQGLYTMDSRNEMLCSYDVFHEMDFPKSCLRLIALSVREDCLAELCSPARANITIPSFTAIYLVQLQEYLKASGDIAFVQEMLPVAETVAKGFADRIDPQNGLIPAYLGEQYWNFYEWQSGLDGRPRNADPQKLTYDAPLCAVVSMAFGAMEKIYKALGMADKAAEYGKLRQELNQNTEKAFWNGEHYNTYIRLKNGEKYHSAELTQALMICCGACPQEKQAAVIELLKTGTLLPATLSYSIFKYEAILADPTNYEWVMDDIAEVWGNMLFNGATTFWETKDGARDFHNAGSLCHGWSAIPLHLYHKYGQP